MAKPFLKWAGGKRWLASTIKDIIHPCIRPYCEPFLGSGAVFFSLAPRGALLADANPELINTFICVRDQPDALVDSLQQLPISRDFFYHIRGTSPSSSIDRATRFLYLNRTAFNGLYRVNKLGNFNVPFGCKETTTTCDPCAIRAASRVLKGVELRAGHYSDTLRSVPHNSVIYADPPYATNSAHSSTTFLRYNDKLFNWQDQVRLATVLRQKSLDGCSVIISNINHASVLSLYQPDAFAAFLLDRQSNMAARASNRGQISELLIVSRDLMSSVLTSQGISALGRVSARTMLHIRTVSLK